MTSLKEIAKKMPENNQGYVPIALLPKNQLGDCYVLAYKEGQYAVWSFHTAHPDSFYWGHYFDNFAEAMRYVCEETATFVSYP